MEELLKYLVLFGAGLTVLIALGQLLRPKKNFAHWSQIAMLATLAIWQGHTAFSLIYPSAPFDLLVILAILHVPFTYAFGPLLYGNGRILIDRDFNPGNSFRIAILLAIFSFLATITALWAGSIPEKSDWKQMALKTYSSYQGETDSGPFLFVLGYGAQFFTIGAVVLILIFTLKSKRTDPAWFRIRRALIFLFILSGAAAFISIIDSLKTLGGVVVTLSVCSLYLIGQRLPIFFELRNILGMRRQSRLQDLEKSFLIDRLEIAMEKDQIFHVEELNLAMLARAVSTETQKITPEQLSEFINVEYKKNFNQFVNDYRVKEACRLLLKNPKDSVLSIGLAVGFNSKSTFNIAFKNFTGQSPGEYRSDKI